MVISRPLVLLVEDIELNRDLVTQILDDEFDVVHAADGLEGVRLAIERLPALILMDLSLPGIDGLEATKRIKADERTTKIPLLALTAHAMTGDRERAIAAGCDDFLTKPVDEVLLLRKLREWIERTRMVAGQRS